MKKFKIIKSLIKIIHKFNRLINKMANKMNSNKNNIMKTNKIMNVNIMRKTKMNFMYYNFENRIFYKIMNQFRNKIKIKQYIMRKSQIINSKILLQKIMIMIELLLLILYFNLINIKIMSENK